MTHVYSSAVNGFAYNGRGILPDSRVLSLEPDREVSLAGNGVKPETAGRPGSPPPPPPAQEVPTGVRRIGGGAIGGSGANYQNVNVAIIDSGIDGSHPDLRVAGGMNFTSTKPQAWKDENGHGTHVAGTVAALDNGFGVVGVAPGASLWAVRVLNRQGFGSVSGIVAGVDWVTATRTDGNTTNDIAVANMSLGIYGTNTALEAAVRRSVNAGVVYTVAAMNESTDASAYSPARYADVITVSALADSDGKAGGLGTATWAGPDDTLAAFSNYGSIIDIAAPGVDIRSTVLNGQYALYSGTSMAAPHVAGVAVRQIAAGGRSALPDGAAVAVLRDDLANLRDDLVDPGFAQPMADWRPDALAINSDRDTFHEGLIQITS